jgi:hypothetical protein
MYTVVKEQQVVREGVTRIETGFGREEDIDLLWSIQSKLKETRFVL